MSSFKACVFVAALAVSDAFVTQRQKQMTAPRAFGVSASSTKLDIASIGVFFGTSTGSTQEVADAIVEEFGSDAEGPFDVDAEPILEMFSKYDALVVGTPTWNTGAETERSGTGWDEIYYGPMQSLDFLKGKKVAVFGLGDQVSYGENYADASGELHDVFEGLGCQMMGYTSQEGYEHEASKAIRGDKFCGLLCDMVNQEELTEERVQNWVAQLRNEGFLVAGSSATPIKEVAPAPPVVTPSKEDEVIAKLEKENAELRKMLEENSALLDQSIGVHNTGYTPHFNQVTGKTMWTSADGRSSYVTIDESKTITSITP